MEDIALNNDSGFYDISITDGDFTASDGLDTAIIVSLVTDKRAAQSEIQQPELRRGWIGNEQNDDPDFQLGSKLWLLDQSRSNQDTLNRANDFIRDCFSWMFDDSLIKDLIVTGTLVSTNIIMSVTFKRFDNTVLNKQFSLWNNTEIA